MKPFLILNLKKYRLRRFLKNGVSVINVINSLYIKSIKRSVHCKPLPALSHSQRLILLGAAGIVTSEDHLAGDGLEDGGNGDLDGLPDHPAGVVHDHHGPVFQVGDALVLLLPLFQDVHFDPLSREDDRFEGVGQFVDVKDLDSVNLGHLVEVEIGGDNLSSTVSRKLKQLEIDLFDLWVVGLADLHIDVGALLELLQDIKASSASLPFEGIRGIRNLLQFVENEGGHHKPSFEETRLADIGHPSIDDGGSIDDLDR